MPAMLGAPGLGVNDTAGSGACAAAPAPAGSGSARKGCPSVRGVSARRDAGRRLGLR